MELYFVSTNPGKIAEISALVPHFIKLKGLNELGFEGEIPETSGTIPGNAMQKARFIHERFGVHCFADDSGLEVDSLDGAPGVDSAYYAGPQKSAADNCTKLLSELRGATNRSARFVTVIALILGGREHLFEGEIRGSITEQPRGKEGFGYDPLFLPDGLHKTFAEMSREEKNMISHRARAVFKLVNFLRTVNKDVE